MFIEDAVRQFGSSPPCEQHGAEEAVLASGVSASCVRALEGVLPQAPLASQDDGNVNPPGPRAGQVSFDDADASPLWDEEDSD